MAASRTIHHESHVGSLDSNSLGSCQQRMRTLTTTKHPEFTHSAIRSLRRGVAFHGQSSSGRGPEAAWVSSFENGGSLAIWNKTGEEIVNAYADEYGNGIVGAWDRKGKGRTLKPGP